MNPGDAYEINGKYIFTPASVSKNEKSTVRVFGEGKKTAAAIELFLLSGKLEQGSKRFNSTLGKINEAEKLEWLKECKVDTSRYTEFSSGSQASSEAANCMHCDCRAHNDCRLRDLSDGFGLKNPREKLTNGPITKKINLKTGLVFENAKCIKCGICVRICNDTVEDPPLCFTGRGFSSIISEPLTDEFINVLKTKTRECVEACPTGALTFIDQ
jgi:ferredoxin